METVTGLAPAQPGGTLPAGRSNVPRVPAASNAKLMEPAEPIPANTFLDSSRTLNEIDEAVRKARARHLSWTLLTMLLEAPGHAPDIALSLEISRETAEHELDALDGQGLVIAVRDTEGCWYRLSDPRVAGSISAHNAPYAHSSPTKSLRRGSPNGESYPVS